MQMYGSLRHLSLVGIRDSSAAFDVNLAATSSVTLTAARTLTIDVANAARSISMSGNLTLANSLTTSGNFPLTFTTTASTNVTFPTSGTLMTNPMTTAGDVIYGGASGVPTRLAAGTATQVLHSGTTPTWAAVTLTTDVTGTLPVANGGTGITSFGAGIATWLGTPSSANLAAAMTDETGTGLLVFATNPVLTTPNLGTPSAAVLTNATGLPLTTGVTGTLGPTNGGTGQSTYTTGDTLYASASNVLSKRAIGTTGQVLTVVGGVPAWAAPGSATNFKTDWTTADTATFAITHNLGTTDIDVTIYDIATGQTIEVDTETRTDANTLTVVASEAPPATSWRVLIQAI